jgi:putative ABC transport system permease protein
MELLESVKMSLSALTANKLRSGLTMLGIAIGNASVIAMVAVGQGAQKLAAEQFEALGPNVLFVSLTPRRLRRLLSSEAKPLLFEDAEAIAEQVPAVAEVAPEIQGTQVVSYQSQTLNGSITGTTPEYLTVRNFRVEQGRFLNKVDLQRRMRVAVLGAGMAAQLFKGQNPLGQQIRINNLSFQVVGVTAAKGSLFGENQDERIVIPLTTMAYQVVGRTSPYGIPLSVISLLARDRDRIDSAQFQVENLLRLRHHLTRPEDIRIFAQDALLETASKTNEGLTRMLAAIASISLLVGGIGVMNIMLVSVVERRQEIGLRKALGARERDILGQFLIEAVILAIAGGTLGIGAGVGWSLAANALSSVTTSISPVSIFFALGVSGGIGLFFGVFPAQRAAKLDPIVALQRL